MRLFQEPLIADCVVLKFALSFSSELFTEVLGSHLLLHTSGKPWKTHSLSQTCWSNLLLPAGFYSCKQSFKIKQMKSKLKNNKHQQHQQPCSEHVGCFPRSLLISWSETQTHQLSAFLKCVEAFFFLLSFFSFPSFLVLICGTRMTLISASLLFIHVTSLTALHQIRLLGFRRALRRHWELL